MRKPCKVHNNGTILIAGIGEGALKLISKVQTRLEGDSCHRGWFLDSVLFIKLGIT